MYYQESYFVPYHTRINGTIQKILSIDPMIDKVNINQRSSMLANVKIKGTKPERIVRECLVSLGVEFLTNHSPLPGKPDIVVFDYNAIIQVHGCFWHGHNCYLFKNPKTRPEFWLNKIESNRNRDLRATRALTDLGFKVLIVWECSLKGKKRLSRQTLEETIEEWLLRIDDSAEISHNGIILRVNNAMEK